MFNYLEILKNFFLPKYYHIKDHENYYFQQDSTPPHRKKEVQSSLNDKFGESFLDSKNWPPRSPDLNPCGFPLGGLLKSKVYSPIPSSLEELKANIVREMNLFKRSNLLKRFFQIFVEGVLYFKTLVDDTLNIY